MKLVQLEIDKSQIFKILNQLDEKDRLKIYNELKKNLFLQEISVGSS